jgi:hypothetical protein
MGTPLLDRIERQKPKEPTPIRRPAWLRRMDELGLPPQDRTGTIKGAA